MRAACLRALSILFFATHAHAVLLYSTPMRNNWAPPADLWNSGWQYEGRFGQFAGTAISPRHFITAGHIGGGVGQGFSFRGQNYTTRAMWDDPNSDLRIFQLDRNMPYYAPMYRGNAEVGKQIVIVGRGVQRGSDVFVNNQRKGWNWGAYDGKESWGTNIVSRLVNGGGGIGSVLMADFNANGGRNEGILSGYDSGGGTFIKDGTTWKLVGVNFAARGPYSRAGQYGGAFNASLFDEGGLWVGADGRRSFINDTAIDAPGASYITRLSTNMPWIDNVLRNGVGPTQGSAAGFSATVPEPGALSLVAITMVLIRRRGR